MSFCLYLLLQGPYPQIHHLSFHYGIRCYGILTIAHIIRAFNMGKCYTKIHMNVLKKIENFGVS